MTELEQATLERETREDTAATVIRLASQYCADCGTRLVGGKCQYGCNSPEPIPVIDQQAELSKWYAANIPPRTCPLCGDRIRPAADKMTGQWWMLRSFDQTWRCAGCSFVGMFSDFCDEHDRKMLPESELVY